jgi:hypothetical protein
LCKPSLELFVRTSSQEDANCDLLLLHSESMHIYTIPKDTMSHTPEKVVSIVSMHAYIDVVVV